MVKMSKVISLMDILPIRKYMDIVEKEQSERDARWLDNQKELGQKGESIVKKFLKERYQASIIVEPDYKGYDFSVKLPNREFVVEVKTTKGNDNRFFISRNELQCAEKMCDLYYIYYIVLEKSKCKLYVINNPIYTLKIDREILYENLVNNEMIQAQIEGLIVTVDSVQLEKFYATEITLF